ncbi:hypothetical protein Tco_1036655 [Tanacetum coccineum]
MHMLTKPQVFYDDTHKQVLGYQNPFYLKKAQRIKPTLYDGSVISSHHIASPVIDDEETLILEEVSQSKMLAKQNDPMSREKKVNTTPMNYFELNRLFEDFGKCFVPQQELSDKQAFWLQTPHPNIDQSASLPVKIRAPRELLKSIKNADLKRQIQDKVFVITSLQNNFQKLKEKEIVENAAQIPIATTIAPSMFKIDLDPLASRLLKNREANIDYLKHTQEQAGNGYVKSGQKRSKMDKTKHEIGMSTRN